MTEYHEYLDSLKEAVDNIHNDISKTRDMLTKIKKDFHTVMNLSEYDAIVMFEELDLAFYEVYEDPEDLEIFDSISTEEANELYKQYDTALMTLEQLNFYVEKYSQIMNLFEEVDYILEGVRYDS